jgi:hypothetical protein
LSVLAVSSKGDVASIKECEAAFGEGWLEEWLARRGLALSDYVEVKQQDSERLVEV